MQVSQSATFNPKSLLWTTKSLVLSEEYEDVTAEAGGYYSHR